MCVMGSILRLGAPILEFRGEKNLVTPILVTPLLVTRYSLRCYTDY